MSRERIREEGADDERASWSSEPAFVFSMAAAAVGLGNLWRFPYMVGEHGGAAFILAYLICLMGIALPIMLMEVGAGRSAQGNTVATFRNVHRWSVPYGWVVVLLTTVITSYYLVITGWTLSYAVDALRFELSSFEQYREGFRGVWAFVIVTGLAAAVLLRGVRAIERMSRALMPVLVAVIVVLVAVAATTDGWSEALAFLTQADFSRWREGSLWTGALGQAFFTLAVGQGYLITYGSFIPRRTNVPRASLVVLCVETGIALLAGLMIFPFVFSQGLDPGEGTQLAFSTLPQVFDEVSGGHALAIAFFGLFFAAAFSSSLAGLKVLISAVHEELGLSHTRAVLLVAGLMLVLGLPSALSFSALDLRIAGEPFLDMVDRVGGTNVVITSGIVGAALFSWIVPRERIEQALGDHLLPWTGFIVHVGRVLPLVLLALVLWNVLG